MNRFLASFLLFALILSGADLSAQRDYARANENLRKLKNGSLLVRLHTKEKNIEALRERGREAQALQLEEKQRQENLELVQSFRSEFNFCPVFFFYSDQSELILENRLDEVLFVDDALMRDPTIRPKLDGFLTAELALVQQNTEEKYDTGRSDTPDHRNRTGEAKYYGKPNLRFHALIIKDEGFDQLERPFPYYSRTLSSIFLKKSMDEVVKTLNKKLHIFSQKRG